jgi:hypothetical protein
MNLSEIKNNPNTKWFIIGGIAVIIFLAIIFGASCGGDKPQTGNPALDNFKPNKAELGQDWKQFKHDASFNAWVFKDEEYPTRPQLHQKQGGAQIFYNGIVTDEEQDLINSGLSEMLAACRQDTNQWSPGNIWTKYPYFQAVPEYKIIFVPSNYTVQEGAERGCAGLITGAHGDCGGGVGTCSAAGTVAGMTERYNSTTPASKGGIYILLPKQSSEQLARTECKMLMKNAVRHESEHIWMSNDSGLYFAHANDGLNGNHPYCRGIVQ